MKITELLLAEPEREAVGRGKNARACYRKEGTNGSRTRSSRPLGNLLNIVATMLRKDAAPSRGWVTSIREYGFKTDLGGEPRHRLPRLDQGTDLCLPASR